jgi:hypothetical protein
MNDCEYISTYVNDMGLTLIVKAQDGGLIFDLVDDEGDIVWTECVHVTDVEGDE